MIRSDVDAYSNSIGYCHEPIAPVAVIVVQNDALTERVASAFDEIHTRIQASLAYHRFLYKFEINLLVLKRSKNISNNILRPNESPNQSRSDS